MQPASVSGQVKQSKLYFERNKNSAPCTGRSSDRFVAADRNCGAKSLTTVIHASKVFPVASSVTAISGQGQNEQMYREPGYVRQQHVRALRERYPLIGQLLL